MDKQAINESIDKIIDNLSNMKDFLSEFKFQQELHNAEDWPEAVPQRLICDMHSDVSKMERARGTVERFVNKDLRDKTFLDFGCGDGHMAYYAAEQGVSMAVGYDIKISKDWTGFKNRNNFKLTTDWYEALSHGPYDVIMCYDVIDHIVDKKPTLCLKKMHDALKEQGQIYLRAHPWVSRHATHIYDRFNKAYAHLIYSEDELKRFVPDYKPEPNLEICYPLKTYLNYFKQVGLRVVNAREHKEPVEPFFQKEYVAKKIMKRLGVNKFPDFQMSLQFVDYVLEKA